MSNTQPQLAESPRTLRRAKPGTLKVPGATLYYEVLGSGPLLVMIPGGPADAGVMTDVARELAHLYTVVAYDPRGNSRSTLDDAPKDQQLDIHADDAMRLIQALGDEPAYVFGTSGGAQIGLNLAVRHPGQVRALLAHEPPCVDMLPDPSSDRAMIERVYDSYRSGGVEAGMHTFMQLTGMAGEMPQVELPPEALETFRRVQGNMDYFLAHGLKPLSGWVHDLEALRSAKATIVVGAGESSEGQLAHRTAVALAGKLGIEPVIFPGGHVGYNTHPGSFAETLNRALQ